MRILIVGGAGAFGSFYAKLFSENGFKVCISDIDTSFGKAICKENGFNWVGKNPKMEDFDIVIVSVPNDAAPNVVKEVGPLLSKGTLLVDFCSVKTPVVKEMKKISGLGLELASIHPMHGPRVKSIAGYPVVCVAVKPGKKLEAIKEFFEKNNANFIFATEEKHDRLLSVVQGLTHYSQFVSAAVLNDLGVDLKETARFGSPNYRLFLSLMSRTILQNPEMYAQLQLSNPYNREVWDSFKKQGEELSQLCKKGDVEALRKRIVESAQEFKAADSFLLDSDRAVSAINHLAETLMHYIGKKFMVENTETGKIHYGRIEGVDGNELVMDEHGKKTRISLGKTGLISKKEMLEWKLKNLKRKQLDYSFLVPKECEKEVIKDCLSHIKECDFKAFDEYESKSLPEGKKSLSFRANFFEDDDPEKIDKRIRKTIKGMGFSFR